jgi:UDP-glucose 4-epimerase
MHIVVTGGAGFIGSHVTEKLQKQGHQVTVVDNLSTGCPQNLPRHSQLHFLNQDIAHCTPTDFNAPIDGCVHLAACPPVKQSWQFPRLVHENNLSNVVKLIELCQTMSIPRLVFASSAAVYGTNVTLPITEDQICRPISPYGLQKWSSEQYLALFAQEFGISAVSLRFFNAYGLRQRPDSEYAGVISKFISALSQHQLLTIYGDGDQTRDFVYIDDIVSAIAQSLIIPLSRGQSLSCNIGTGCSVSINQLVDILRDLFPYSQSEVRYVQAQPGDIRHSCADIRKAKQTLGFQPKYTIKTGLQDYIQAELNRF